MVVGLDDAVGGAALAGDVAIRGTLVSLSFPFLLLGFFFLAGQGKRAAGVVECWIFFLSWLTANSLPRPKMRIFKIPNTTRPHLYPSRPTGKNIQIDNLSSFVLHFDGFVGCKVDDDG